MRLPEVVRKSVVFVAYRHSSGADGFEDVDLDATAFCVAYPSSIPNKGYFYLVTARHSIEGNHGGEPGFVLNTLSGERQFYPMEGQWYTHPEKTVDVAVTPFTNHPSFDFKYVPTAMFLGANLLQFPEGAYGLGSDVFFPGLFVFASGDKRAIPIVRTGSLAMVPDGPILSYRGVSENYLIEARSIGGISGSPVFIRPLVDYPVRINPNNQEVTGLISIADPCPLLGMIGGHYDMEGDINKYELQLTSKVDGVNMGLAYVIPSQKILETLEIPVLAEARRLSDDALRKSMTPNPDRSNTMQ